MEISNLIIIGSPKCCTTTLYFALSEHPFILSASRKEPHFFDYKWKEAKKYKLSKKQKEILSEVDHQNIPQKKILAKYLQNFQINKIQQIECENRKCVTLDATATYIIFSKTGNNFFLKIFNKTYRIHKYLPDAKIIICIRDPIDRAYSHFMMSKDQNGTESQKRQRGSFRVEEKTFHQVVLEEIEILEQNSITPDCDITLFENYLKKIDWKSNQNDIPIYKNFQSGHSFIVYSLFYLEIQLWLKFFQKSQIKIVQQKDLENEENFKTCLNSTFNFLGLDSISTVFDKKNVRQYPPMENCTKQILEEYFKLYNKKLKKLLQEEFETSLNW